MLRFGRLPPVDGGCWIFHAIAAELPEGFAHAGLAAPVHPEPDARRQALRLHQEWRERRAETLGFLARAVPAFRLARIERLICRARHALRALASHSREGGYQR